MAETRKSNGPLTLLGNGALLLCAVAGLLRTFLSLYPAVLRPFTATIPDSFTGSPAQLTLVAVFAALISLAVWSLPRYRVPVVCFLAALLGAAAYHYHIYLIAGAKLTFQAVANLFSEKVGWTRPVELTIGLIFAQDRLDAVLLFLTAATVLLALLLGWMVVRCRRWWMVMLVTLPPLLPGLLAEVPFDWTYLIMLGSCWCAMLLTSLCKWSPSRGGLTLAALPACALLLGALLLISPPQDYVQPEWATEVQNDLVSFANRHFPSLNPGEGVLELPSNPTGPTIPTFVGSVEHVDLSAAGPLNYSGRTVLRVSGDYTGRVYLRGMSQAQYTGDSWEPLEEETYGDYSIQPLLFPSYTHYSGESCTVTVENVGASSTTVYLPYQLAEQDFAGLGCGFLMDSALYSNKSKYTAAFLPGALDLPQGLPVMADNAVQEFNRYSHFAREVYGQPSGLDLPPLTMPINSALQGTVIIRLDTHSYLHAAREVAELLDELCEYDPKTPAPPEGEDFVEYFLTESRRGYCMHFASAAVLILRDQGIPARYVSGFVADLEAGQTVRVPDYNAHAWVEVLLPGYGWYPVEVTPGYEGDGNPAAPAPTETPSPSPSVAPEPSESPDLPSLEPSPALPSNKPSPQPTPTPSAPVVDEKPTFLTLLLPVLLEVLKWLAVAAAAAVLLWLGQYLPKRHRQKRLNSVNTNQAALDCYRWLTRLTRWGGLVDSTALELAQKARFSQHLLTEEERMMMAVLFHDERRRIGGRLSLIPGLVFRYLWDVPKE